MNLREIFRQTFTAIRTHRMRSFLTMFGIVWGMVSVILLVGLGLGFGRDQQTRMKTLGTDVVIVWGGRTSEQAGGYTAGREIRLSIDDVLAIQAECYSVKAVSPELRQSLPETSQFNSANRPVRGVWPAYQDFRSLEIGEGRPMSTEDEAEGRRVVVLGYEARQQLFNGKPAVDSTVMIKGLPYIVIGVLSKKKQNSNYGSGGDNTQLFIPYRAMARDFPRATGPGITRNWLNNLVFEVGNPDDHEQAVQQVYRTLGRLHHFDPADKDALFVWDTMSAAKLLKRIFSVMTFFFGAVAITTLSLGGIGVMNIMLVSVSERTREIGVRKALGATRRDIVHQFFAESAMLTLVSGALGLTFGMGLCLGLASISLPEFIPHPIISPLAVIAALATLSVLTVTAGMYPALRAADLTPVECLRYE
jgi:putative ABC transport system permease protein